MTLEGAAAEVSFGVWFPQVLAADWRHDVSLFGGDTVVVLIRHAESPHGLTILQRAAGRPPEGWDWEDPEPLEPLDHGGEQVFVQRRTSETRESRVRLEREGTYVELSSASLPLEALLGLVGSLRPVRR